MAQTDGEKIIDENAPKSSSDIIGRTSGVCLNICHGDRHSSGSMSSLRYMRVGGLLMWRSKWPGRCASVSYYPSHSNC